MHEHGNLSEVRRQMLTSELTKRAARLKYHLHWDTLTKILAHPEPLGYRQRKERGKLVLGPFIPLILQILEADKKAPKRQRHKVKRISNGCGSGLHRLHPCRQPGCSPSEKKG